MGRIKTRAAAAGRPAALGLSALLAVTLGVGINLGASSQAVPANSAAAASDATNSVAAATNFSKMSQGTNLKADPSYFVAPTNPLCSANAQQSMQDFKVTGGDHIALVIPLVQTSVKSSVITRRADTASDACLASAIRNARAVGLTVNLKPLLEFRQCVKVPMANGGSFCSLWRGRIKPSDRDQWQRNWNYWMQHYAGIARQEGAESLTIGTEMVGVTKGNSKRWEALVKWLHARAPGVKIAYAANRVGEVDHLSKAFVASLDQFGVTFYPTFDFDGELTEQKIYTGLQQYTANFKATSARFGRTLTIFEMGWRSRKGTHRETSDGTPRAQSVVSLKEQLLGYAATLRYLSEQKEVNGVYTWLWETDPHAGGPRMSDYTVQNKPAEAVQAKWFAGAVPEEVEWLAPLDGTSLSGHKDFIKVRLADHETWPAGSYTAQYRFNDNKWYSLRLVPGTNSYRAATIYPSKLPKGPHKLTVRVMNNNGQLVALSSKMIER